jgi:hypothetical protein
LPVAGRGYSSQTLPLVFDLVNLINDHSNMETVDDQDGQSTILYLKNCQKVLNRVTGTHPSSLGLHPVVYFYSSTGRYQPTAFFAVLELVKDMEQAGSFKAFISVRRKFEEFVLKYKMLPLQVVYKYGSGTKGYQPLKELLAFIISSLQSGQNEDETIQSMSKETRFSYLLRSE